MRLEPSVLCFLHCKSECIKQFACTQPHKTTFAFVDIGLVGRGKARTHFGVNAITGNDQVGLVLRANVGVGIDFGFKHQLNAHLFTAFLQNIEQALAANATKTMAAGAHGFALEMHGDVIPVIERTQNF